MIRSATDLVRSEIGTLERFLGELADEDIIERSQLEHRLASARARLGQLEGRPSGKAMPITFRGEPVDGDRAISASFAGLAIKALVDAVETVAADLAFDDLKTRGRLPGLGGRSLQIVDTLRGSFGFELELPPTETVDSPRTGLPQQATDPLYVAITTTMALLGEAASDNDEAISDLVADLHPRAIAKVLGFARVLADHHALVDATFEGRRLRLDSHDQVQRVVRSLDDADLTEKMETHPGVIVGILPQSRAFEAVLQDGGFLRGKVSRAVDDVLAFKKAWENREALLQVRVVKVRDSRRYVLEGATSPRDQQP